MDPCRKCGRKRTCDVFCDKAERHNYNEIARLAKMYGDKVPTFNDYMNGAIG